MTIYPKQAVRAVCDLIDMEYEKTYLNRTMNGTPLRIFREGTFVYIDMRDDDSFLSLYEEPDIESVIDALFEANKDRVKIVDKIEEMSARYGSTEESESESESKAWTPWPSDFRTPPDDELCLVTFVDNGHGRTLVGKYHEEFSLWAFPTLDGRVQTFTANDKNISEVYWRPI